MNTLAQQLRWNVFWKHFRNETPSRDDPGFEQAVTDKINAMTNMELVEAISEAEKDRADND